MEKPKCVCPAKSDVPGWHHKEYCPLYKKPIEREHDIVSMGRQGLGPWGDKLGPESKR